MEKHIWRRAQTSIKSQSQPIPRWGHNCCVVRDQIVFFGGYADSNYMNDIWTYHTLKMEWNQIKTTGDVPSNRSNCSMNYDRENNRIIVFGGGGPNKKRFNTINILDWTTKEWIQIQPKENEPSPWERTYHSAELVYPYLIVYGGEGVADMDDLWVYNFLTLSWTEVPIDKSRPRPCARRFHSSALVGNQLFIIAGCHGKYRPLNDVFCMDLSPLIQQNNVKKLQWKERKFKGSAFLTRWGQSSSVYDNKIYIFGGRFSSDLNDILVIDLEKQTMKALKTGSELPKPRRRHCACFIGSCMIIFGGFNGEYFNDLYYINVFELRSKLTIPESKKNQMRASYINETKLSDHVVNSKDGKMPIHKGILIKCFQKEENMNRFLSDIDGKFSNAQLLDIFRMLYNGYGKIPKDIMQKYQIILSLDQQQRQKSIKTELYSQFDKNQQIVYPLGKKNSINNSSPVIVLDDSQFSDFIQKRRNPRYTNFSILANQAYQIRLNSMQLALSSQYFTNLLSLKFGDLRNNQIDVELSQNNILIFEILLNYLELDYVIIPREMGYRQWAQLCSIAEFYCLGRLVRICEQQLCLKVNQQNVKQIMNTAIEFEMQVLLKWCVDFELKIVVSRQQAYMHDYFTAEKNKIQQEMIKYLFQLLKFDIYQSKLDRDRVLDGDLKKKQSVSTQGEKENYQINYNQ